MYLRNLILNISLFAFFVSSLPLPLVAQTNAEQKTVQPAAALLLQLEKTYETTISQLRSTFGMLLPAPEFAQLRKDNLLKWKDSFLEKVPLDLLRDPSSATGDWAVLVHQLKLHNLYLEEKPTEVLQLLKAVKSPAKSTFQDFLRVWALGKTKDLNGLETALREAVPSQFVGLCSLACTALGEPTEFLPWLGRFEEDWLKKSPDFPPFFLLSGTKYKDFSLSSLHWGAVNYPVAMAVTLGKIDTLRRAEWERVLLKYIASAPLDGDAILKEIKERADPDGKRPTHWLGLAEDYLRYGDPTEAFLQKVGTQLCGRWLEPLASMKESELAVVKSELWDMLPSTNQDSIYLWPSWLKSPIRLAMAGQYQPLDEMVTECSRKPLAKELHEGLKALKQLILQAKAKQAVDFPSAIAAKLPQALIGKICMSLGSGASWLEAVYSHPENWIATTKADFVWLHTAMSDEWEAGKQTSVQKFWSTWLPKSRHPGGFPREFFAGFEYHSQNDNQLSPKYLQAIHQEIIKCWPEERWHSIRACFEYLDDCQNVDDGVWELIAGEISTMQALESLPHEAFCAPHHETHFSRAKELIGRFLTLNAAWSVARLGAMQDGFGKAWALSLIPSSRDTAIDYLGQHQEVVLKLPVEKIQGILGLAKNFASPSLQRNLAAYPDLIPFFEERLLANEKSRITAWLAGDRSADELLPLRPLLDSWAYLAIADLPLTEKLFEAMLKSKQEETLLALTEDSFPREGSVSTLYVLKAWMTAAAKARPDALMELLSKSGHYFYPKPEQRTAEWHQAFHKLFTAADRPLLLSLFLTAATDFYEILPPTTKSTGTEWHTDFLLQLTATKSDDWAWLVKYFQDPSPETTPKAFKAFLGRSIFNRARSFPAVVQIHACAALKEKPEDTRETEFVLDAYHQIQADPASAELYKSAMEKVRKLLTVFAASPAIAQVDPFVQTDCLFTVGLEQKLTDYLATRSSEERASLLCHALLKNRKALANRLVEHGFAPLEQADHYNRHSILEFNKVKPALLTFLEEMKNPAAKAQLQLALGKLFPKDASQFQP